MHRSSDTLARHPVAAGRTGGAVSPVEQAGRLPDPENQHRNLRNYLNSAAAPIDRGSAADGPLRPLSEMPEMPLNPIADGSAGISAVAEERAMSLESRFSGLDTADATSKRSRGSKGLRALAEKRSERDPVCR
jgi:hypothetical protein